MLEGLLALYPHLANLIEVQRIEWSRPRQDVIDLIGAQNQSLPVLILAHAAPDGLETDEFEGRRFVEGKDRILQALSALYGLPLPHP